MVRSFAGIAMLALSALTLSDPAATEETKMPCPFVRSVDNFKVVDDYTAIIETGPSRKYLVKFANNCRELKWSWSARVEARPGICLRPGDVIVAGQQNGIPGRCYISSITQLPANTGQTPASY